MLADEGYVGKGFGSYLESGDFADLELQTERRTYRVHRLLLIYASDYFASLLTSEFKERDSTRVELKLEDPCDLFPKVLQFIYEGHVNITESNAMPLLALSDHYLIDSLRQKAAEFICAHTNRSNVIATLRDSLSYNVQEVIDRCISIIAKNFCRFQSHVDWNFLPSAIFCRLLQEEYLTVGDEHELYQLVRAYIKQNSDRLNTQQIEHVMGCIRFRWMSYEQLEQVLKDAIVPFSLFTEAIMARLLYHENPDRLLEQELLNPRYLFPSLSDKSPTHSSDNADYSLELPLECSLITTMGWAMVSSIG